jgi:hypothetical protein
VEGTAGRRQRSLPSKLRYGGQLLWWLVRNPVENAAQSYERRVTARGWRPDAAYPVDEDWESQLHQLLGAPWPCAEQESFNRHWEAAVAELAARGLVVGREAFGGWDDGDRALARAAWCLTRHCVPERVVETGVGRGLTSRTILEGLEANGSGRLWSIDQPPPLSPALKRQTGVAVPEALRSRWTYVRGSSRQRLPDVVSKLGTIDLFVHDSMHTTRNVEFELERVWPALSDRAAILVDDIDMNRGFERFAERHDHATSKLIALSDDGQRHFGVITRAD